jgi:hypothetical protein
VRKAAEKCSCIFGISAGQELKCLGGHGWPGEAAIGGGQMTVVHPQAHSPNRAPPSPVALRAPTSPASGRGTQLILFYAASFDSNLLAAFSASLRFLLFRSVPL